MSISVPEELIKNIAVAGALGGEGCGIMLPSFVFIFVLVPYPLSFILSNAGRPCG
jgi:hypothetical protein